MSSRQALIYFITLEDQVQQCALFKYTNSLMQNGKKYGLNPPNSCPADIQQGKTFRIYVFSQTDGLNQTLGLGTLPLISHFGGTELSKKQVVYMDPSYVSPMELLMPLNRRMSDCDKLIDPFCGNTSALITGNAVQLAHIRSLTCSHNNKLTQS